MSSKKTVNLKLNGIHCNGCAAKIKKNLDKLNMDHTTDVNSSTGNVKIIFDADKAGLSDIKSKITELGFQVESIELE
jgi:copper chaperone CopZ